MRYFESITTRNMIWLKENCKSFKRLREVNKSEEAERNVDICAVKHD